MLSFLFLISTHPTVQTKAQAEIDRIIDSQNRLPVGSDAESCEYILALTKEVMRCYPPTPLGLFHRTALHVDDVYNGWDIPGGTTIVNPLRLSLSPY